MRIYGLMFRLVNVRPILSINFPQGFQKSLDLSRGKSYGLCPQDFPRLRLYFIVYPSSHHNTDTDPYPMGSWCKKRDKNYLITITLYTTIYNMQFIIIVGGLFKDGIGIVIVSAAKYRAGSPNFLGGLIQCEKLEKNA